MDRLDIKDAIYHFARDRGDSRDQFSLTAFDSVDRAAPSFDEIVAHMEARAPLVPGLRLRLREAPLNLDYPRWVPDTSPLAERMSDHDLGGASWADFETLMGDLLRTRLDLREHSWHLYVVRGIGSAPLMQGPVTVVILQVGHALTDGLGVSKMVRALVRAVVRDRCGSVFGDRSRAGEPRRRRSRCCGSGTGGSRAIAVGGPPSDSRLPG
ncbi:wax ester/triacylglycerol synthase family O-acyltransferase, partial [Rhodococcus sp. BS-15]|uniref:wax ester/triacylglycerol synthase family O-acyltransferase n=1 Tax=Rhodococcus sp. BS-15 TaxID=1304954 RepID=UPI001F44C12E